MTSSKGNRDGDDIDVESEPIIQNNSNCNTLKYIPAGLYARQFMSESSLYVSLLPVSKHRHSISYEEKSRSHVILKLYDRDVHIVRNTAKLFDEDFDYQCNNSIFGKDNIFTSDFGLDRTLVSAHNGLHELKRDRKDNWRPTSSTVKIIGDSGGFQLRLGTTPYIDPNEVIDWMNDFVDIGASLDIVPRMADMGNKKIIFGLSEAQRRNNELFLSKAREDLKFMNVVHGFTIEDARNWCDRVKTTHPAFLGWATGADSNNFYNNMLVALTPMLEFQDYNGKKGLHFFGVSGKTYIPVLAWLAKASKVPITMDSTNYLKGNRYRLFYFLDTSGRMVDIPMGRLSKLGYRTELPCNCPVCYSIKWCEAFRFEGMAKMQHMLTIHNLITTLRYTQRWNSVAARSNREEYEDAVKHVYRKHSARGILDSIDFIESCLSIGLDKTQGQRKYAGWTADDSHMEEGSSGMEELFPGEGPRTSREEDKTMVAQKYLESSKRTLFRYIPKAEVNKLWEQEKKKKRGRHDAEGR